MPDSCPPVPDSPQPDLDETRSRFVAAFFSESDSIRILLDKVAAFGPRGPVAALTQTVRRLDGRARRVGFRAVSERAAELEALVGHGGTDSVDYSLWRRALDRVRQ